MTSLQMSLRVDGLLRESATFSIIRTQILRLELLSSTVRQAQKILSMTHLFAPHLSVPNSIRPRVPQRNVLFYLQSSYITLTLQFGV